MRPYLLAMMLVLVCACAQGTEDVADDAPIDDDVCGDGECTGAETPGGCPMDCGDAARCGDGECNGTENFNTCPGDCGGGTNPVCGDGQCSGGETVNSCAQDCATGPVCGDGNCNGGETATSCPQDCTGGGGFCGDGSCGAGEDDLSCPSDCGGGGGGTCDHDVCTVGGPLDSSCGTCEAEVCANDDWCCSFEWDQTCVDEANQYCGAGTCP